MTTPDQLSHAEAAPRVMPVQKPGRSVQEVETPREFLDAVQNRFKPIVWDLAADPTNHVVEDWYGPGSPHCEDAFKADWPVVSNGVLWLNPPYGDIARWAAACSKFWGDGWLASGQRICLLVPASVGTNWFAEHVDRQALVLFLRPRLTFVGHRDPYPKDLMLAVYGEGPGYECWRWR